MSDPIDRQDVLSLIRMAMPEETSGSLLYQSVKQLPTIDAVPVVRCKDCAFNDEFAWYACPMLETAKQKDDDFCSRGRRRTDATD